MCSFPPQNQVKSKKAGHHVRPVMQSNEVVLLKYDCLTTSTYLSDLNFDKATSTDVGQSESNAT